MSLKCWQALVLPTLIPSHTMLKEFYGPFFPPRRLILAYVIELGGKRVKVHVKVVYLPIYCNFLLGLNWIHAMITIVY